MTRMAGAAMLSPWRLARGWAPKNMMAVVTEPRTMKVTRQTRKTRFTWL